MLFVFIYLGLIQIEALGITGFLFDVFHIHTRGYAHADLEHLGKILGI